jgi:hypothetical protein
MGSRTCYPGYAITDEMKSLVNNIAAARKPGTAAA